MAISSTNSGPSKGGLLPFLACILISGSLWLLVQTSKNDIFTTEIAIEITKLPKNVKILGPMPREILVKQTTTGINFLYHSIFQRHLFSFEYQPHWIKTNVQGKKYILIQNLLRTNPFFENSLTKLISLDSDTIFLESGKFFNKKVPVKLNFLGKFEDGCFLVGFPKPTPSEVIVTGRRELLQKIDTLILDANAEVPLKENVQIRIGLPSQGALSILDMHPKAVSFTLQIEKFTEKILTVNIKPINIPAGKRVKLLPEKIDLITAVPLSKYEEANGAIFEVVADFNGQLINNRVKLKIEKIPSYCKNTRLNSDLAEFILIR